MAVTPAVKRCTICKTTKSLTEFHRQARNKDGLQYVCKVCRSLEAQQRYQTNPEKILARNRVWRERNPERLRELINDWRQRNRKLALSYQRKSRLKHEFGMTPEDYDRMFANQHGCCLICHQPETRTVQGKISRLAIDHDHNTDQVRGLLCYQCNNGLGRFKDNPDRLRAAARYLEESSCL